MTAQPNFKITENIGKPGKTTNIFSKTTKRKENDLKGMLRPTTFAVMSILPCPRVMTMQCWKSLIPSPLPTKLSIFLFVCLGPWFESFLVIRFLHSDKVFHSRGAAFGRPRFEDEGVGRLLWWLGSYVALWLCGYVAI